MHEIMKCGAREFSVPSLKLLPFPGRISGYFSTLKDGNNECLPTIPINLHAQRYALIANVLRLKVILVKHIRINYKIDQNTCLSENWC